MIRSAKAVIDLQALRHNLSVARQSAGSSRVLAVVKADAYGHGIVTVAEALADLADGMAVACLPEAQILRKAGHEGRILLLQGVKDVQEQRAAAELDLDLVVQQAYQLDLLQNAESRNGLDIWLKLDTGMHRLGFPPTHAALLIERLRGLSVVRDLRLMTHFSDADDRSSKYTERQLQAFDNALVGQAGEQSCANSAAILGHSDTHRDWVRPGIMLYGASPFVGGHARQDGLRPVMQLTAPLIALNAFKKGDTIGYGRTWACPEDMQIGVAAIGYGDGYPRHAKSGTPVMIDGVRTQIVGRVSMDMITIDLRPMPGARVGMSVQLWGDGVPADEVASAADTIAYELFCSVGYRVRRAYID